MFEGIQGILYHSLLVLDNPFLDLQERFGLLDGHHAFDKDWNRPLEVHVGH